jgi:hypothetical protein
MKNRGFDGDQSYKYGPIGVESLIRKGRFGMSTTVRKKKTAASNGEATVSRSIF